MTRYHRFWLLAIAVAVLSGCVKDHTAAQLDARAQENAWMVATPQQDMVRGAVIAQATIYPYHFVHGSAELNELGARDVGYLAEHFVGHAGGMNVRRGATDDTLYEARVKTVRQMLTTAGVPEDRIAISDGHPGGDGLRAERALYVLEQDVEPLDTAVSTRDFTESSN